MSFKSQKEIWEHLLNGGKIKHDGWKSGYVCIGSDGYLSTSQGDRSNHAFDTVSYWQIYKQPKEKKNVTLYRYTYKWHTQDEISQGVWTTGKCYNSDENCILLHTETKTIEITL